LIDRTNRSEHIHDFPATPESGQWKPATQDFAKTGQIGFHIEDLLSAAEGYTEASNHFVKDQQRSISPRDLA
jgi:hypothetical protein